jgi:hypothetical protein
MAFSDYPQGSLFLNINGLHRSALEFVEPVDKAILTHLPLEVEKLKEQAKKLRWSWKTVNIYRRR